MAVSEIHEKLVEECRNLYDDCNYTSLTYFAAAKSANRWAMGIIFWPAVVSAVAAFLVALNQPKQIGAVSAVASTVVATASYLGTGRRADSLRESASKLTVLRHKVRLEMSLASQLDDTALESTVRDLRAEYANIVTANELVSDRFFTAAQKKIKAKTLEYDQ